MSNTESLGDKVAGLLRDTGYVLIGASVLTVQQLQVRRREITKTLAEHEVTNVVREQLRELRHPAD